MKKQRKRRRQDANKRTSVNVRIGGNASGPVTVAGDDIRTETYISQRDDTVALIQLFDKITQKLDTLPQQVESVKPEDIVGAKAEVENLKKETIKGEQADEDFLTRCFRNIASMGPDILDVVTAMLQNPAAGVAQVVLKIATKAREEAGLSPVRQQ